MSEEEKKIIKFLKIFSKTEIDYCKLEKADVLDILNLINKQQKEIENYKNLIEDVSQIAKELKLEEDGTIDEILVKIKQQQKEIEEFKGIKNGTTIIYKGKAKYVREDKINKYYISKNRVREKIREVSNGTYDAKIILEQLLEE